MKSAECYTAIECLQHAAESLGCPLDMVALLSSPRFHPEKGQIPQQIADLANEQKLNAVVLNHITTDQMACSNYPMILHVWGGQYSSRPDFYVLCTGVRSGKATLFAPPNAEMTVPLPQLQEARRAEAVVLSREPLPPDAPVLHRSFPIVQCMVMFGVLASAVTLTFTRLKKARAEKESRISRIRMSSVQLGWLLFLSMTLTFVCRSTSGQSIVPAATSPGGQPIDFLLSNAPDSDTPGTLHDISIETALRLVSENTLFVDARDSSEFSAGHIRGAIWCPADDVGRWQLHMAGVDLHRRIVVYCAEASCHKGEYVARFLIKNGFTDVSLFRPGWAKWTGPREFQ